MSLEEVDDNYEEWKKIDGFFASLGLNGELTEESMEQFLKKDRSSSSNSIGDWLDSFGFGIYENILSANGFDDIKMLNGGVLEETDLHLMGFTNIHHINRLLLEVSKLPSLSPVDVNRLPATVSDWLSSLSLDMYTETFYRLGYDTMARVLQIWEIELATVLSVVFIGHQKRILVSLGDSRPGFDTIRRKHRSKISTISNIHRLEDTEEEITSDEHLDPNQHEQLQVENSPDEHTMSHSDELVSPATISLEGSDSGCSVASDRLETLDNSTSNNSNRPHIPSSPHSTPTKVPDDITSFHHGYQNGPVSPHNCLAAEMSSTYKTKASFNRSQTAKSITKTVTEAQRKFLSLKSRRSIKGGTGARDVTRQNCTEENDTSDYANMTESGIPLVGDIEGLKLSKSQEKSNKSIQRRPLPELPSEERISFTKEDLPPDFKSSVDPEILISGCVNFSACYLGTCLVSDMARPDLTRDAIARMKLATQSLKKLPIVTLSISFKGVDFIDSSTQRSICEHEITNIYSAAQDANSLNYFAYITNDVFTKGLYCHVFCVKSEELARQVIMTLGEAFDIAFYATQKHPKLVDLKEY
ncbi:ankyrin repeat and sterile alpha motif domain-containing protein 1B-like [Watersipora subatra]|uniref:ankyrin repeat and sterile alpha motif domain-containing protein 1B-like n=1 Tax=Watersipora subatra TaxID=2589382 RepID=UPI00355B51A7